MPLDTFNLVNSQRYPIHEPEGDALQDIITQGRARLREEGLCVLNGFLEPAMVQQIIKEMERLIPMAFHNTLYGNCYLSDIDPKLPRDDVRTWTDRTALAVIAYDQIPKNHLIRQIYESDAVMRFVESLVNRGRLYRYACPMGALNLTVMKAGDYLRWHFDQSDFVVSINLRDPDEGGIYEYVKDLRSPEDENYQGVKEALKGMRKDVKILQAQPGALILFEGRYTLHRVTEIKGETARLGALFGYALQPNLDSTDYLKQIRYGRTKPLIEH